MSKTHTLNGIGHFDIAGPDLAPLSAFYSTVLGWQVTPRGPGYGMITTPEGSPNGALLEAETASLTVGVVVPDLTAALSATQSNGGTIAMPLTDNGWVKKAQVRDPAGNLLTLIQG
jgi:predicted enzyme related to lactoylglutathione lyase